MNKYDFGYELQEGTTNYWAYEIIESGSKVLELGSSVGMLTKNLKDKNCIVDIIEIDIESGNKASVYARKSCIGNTDGNIEDNIWIDKIAGETYDYIIMLDVLEHLNNPKKVLNIIKQFLNESGKVILSVPNIAHNSVLINLLNNKFEYTRVGLLDDTHVHFFTLDSLKKMITDTGYSCIKQECIQKPVGENEIANSYSDIPPRIAAYLKMREGAEIYQFLFVLVDKRKEIQEETELISINKRRSPYWFEIYNNEELRFSHPVDTNKIDLLIPLKGNGKYRIDPVNVKCILDNITIVGLREGTKINLDLEDTNGIFLKRRMLFADDDPQFFIEINNCDSLVFKADILLLEDPLIEQIYSNMNSEILKKIDISNDFIQVFYSTENNKYSEENCVCRRILNDRVINKRINLKSKKIRFIRLDPISVSGRVRIRDIIVKCKDENPERICKFKSNADRIENNVYTFFHNDSKLIIDIGTCKQVEYIEFKADILETDLSVEEKQMHPNLKQFLQQRFKC